MKKAKVITNKRKSFLQVNIHAVKHLPTAWTLNQNITIVLFICRQIKHTFTNKIQQISFICFSHLLPYISLNEGAYVSYIIDLCHFWPKETKNTLEIFLCSQTG